MNTVQVDIVTPERKVFEGQATMVIARGVEGELGILPGHTPLVTPLKVGVLQLKEGTTEKLIAISGGFLEVRPDKVTVLAETAELPEEIDVDRAENARRRAEQRLANLNKSDRDFDHTEIALARAINRIRVAKWK
ncbi:F0F1 ATP synthase subunit epsilon [Caldalkalibacillus mannanilyticus]|uniref:F0F1 ATP synthase subunit epsilon n=1 Tax=Caldalkalibacillus mannanilyticus TaxID=1418 RepID=UPI00046A2A35|nr:F0F1 ATP synthase subunit epsilon [Caldalkalibacillus mannanilyticus]